MDKAYSPADIETRIYAQWESRGYFAPSGKGPAFSIVIPPPNVTGTLHMGHAFQDTIMDALMRYQRMRGFDTLWQPGTDHAGIATQMVVERQLNAAGQSRVELGRDAFVARVWQWKEDLRRNHRQTNAAAWAPRSIGQRDIFTMDPAMSLKRDRGVRALVRGRSHLSRQAPGELGSDSEDGAVGSRSGRPTEETGSLWHLRYPLSEGPGYLVVATTRPETMLGDAAVAVHPDDERYRHLIGRRVRLPLTIARAFPSSPTPMWTRPSAAAASRSRRRTTSTTTSSESGTTCP